MLKPTLGSQLQLGHPLACGLVGLWLLNEGSEGKVFDLSGNGQHLTESSTPPDWGAGKFGTAGVFNGSTHMWHRNLLPSLVVQGEWTMVAWVNPGHATNTMSFCGTRSAEYGTEFRFTGGNTISSIIGDGSGWIDTSANITFNYSVDTWYQVVYVMDTAGWNGYVNGIWKASEAHAGNPLWSDATHYPAIGSYRSSGGQYWQGKIDHVMIYNRTLSASEIAQRYREPFCMFERDPIELWSAATQGGAPPAGIPIFRRRRAG